MHLADAFIQSDLVHSGYTFFVSKHINNILSEMPN